MTGTGLRIVFPEGTICVGLSGGLDSVVLLDLAVRAGAKVSAVHVHHGLSPNADDWAEFCGDLCRGYGVALTVERLQVERASGAGLEAAARAARYAVYAARPEDYVALAHHLDDQSETVLLQLLRGAGLKGVAAMPPMRALARSHVRVIRPLLGLRRDELRAYAQMHALRWIEDESNESLRHDRNFLRHEIAPRLDARLPRWREAAARFARHAASAERLLGELAALDGLPREAGMDLAIGPALSDERRANLLRAFLALNGLAMPSEARVAEMARQLFEAGSDARVCIAHDGMALVRFRDRVRLERIVAADAAWQLPWHGELEVDLGEAHGSVCFEPATGEGLALARVGGTGWHFRARAGGERLRIHPKRPTRTLKHLLQEHAVPPWERDAMPLLFHDDQLVWAPRVGIEPRYAAAPGEPGLRPLWRRSDTKTPPAKGSLC